VRHEFTRTEQRPLSDQEHQLVRWLINSAGQENYLPQVPRLRIVTRCTCGCPSVDFALDGRLSKRHGPADIIADAEGLTAEGALVGVILRAREGEVSELGVYSMDGAASTFNLPSPSMLKVI
jgi:hypothetical protein